MTNLVEKLQCYFPNSLQIKRVIPITHDGNNNLYEIRLENLRYILKQYATHQADQWNRAETEYRALSYLWGIGYKNIPLPIKFFKEDNVAVYSFVKGKHIEASSVNKNDIEAILDFLVSLHRDTVEGKKFFPPARSACLTIQDYLYVIDSRINQLQNQPRVIHPLTREGLKFLNGQVIPIAEELRSKTLKSVPNKDLSSTLSLDKQVLTPADFGFHNILFQQPNKYNIVDFEYFGRDDPVRQVLDFIHHDTTRELSTDLKTHFLNKYIMNMQLPEQSLHRMRLVDPLIGITWVLIYLNVLSSGYQKHVLSSSRSLDQIMPERLGKAKQKIDSLYFFHRI